MLVASETYKGIKFVRISSLPLEQKNYIHKSINPNTIIKILQGDTLLNDCVQYKHYENWYRNIYSPLRDTTTVARTTDHLAIAS